MAPPPKEGTLEQELGKVIRLICAPSNNTLIYRHQKRAPPCARRRLEDGRVFWNVTASFPAVWTFPTRATHLPLHRPPYSKRTCSSSSRAQGPKRVNAAGLPAWLARTASSHVTLSTCWTWALRPVAGCSCTGGSTALAALRRTWSRSGLGRKIGLAGMDGRTLQRLMDTRQCGEGLYPNSLPIIFRKYCKTIVWTLQVNFVVTNCFQTSPAPCNHLADKQMENDSYIWLAELNVMFYYNFCDHFVTPSHILLNTKRRRLLLTCRCLI